MTYLNSYLAFESQRKHKDRQEDADASLLYEAMGPYGV
jgi:hypothetical protein